MASHNHWLIANQLSLTLFDVKTASGYLGWHFGDITEVNDLLILQAKG